MDNSGGRTRSANFTPMEEVFLVDSVERKFNILWAEQGSSIKREQKKRVWEEVGQDFENKFGMKRNPKSLKLKYDNIKIIARKTLREEERQLGMSSGATVAQSSTDQMMDVLNPLMETSATGQDNAVDSENVSQMQNSTSIEEAPVEVPSNDFVEHLDDLTEGVNAAVNEVTGPGHSTISAPVPSTTNEEFNQNPNERADTVTQVQVAYFLNEERRANQKHAWARQRYEWEKELSILSKDKLRLDLEIRKKELDSMNMRP